MAVPRPVLLALLGLGLVAALFLVTRSGSSESVRGPAKTTVAPSAPAPAAPRKSGHGKAVAPARPRQHVAAKPAKPASRPAVRRAAAAPAATLTGRVLGAARALAADQVVVFLFSKPGSADDEGARAAVASIRGVPGIQVFDASLDEVAAFRPMLSNVGISQVPSTVIVRPGRKAVVIQGFVDGGTLSQNVADALR